MLRKKPTKRRMEAAAIQSTNLAQQGAAIIQQLLIERVAMDDAIDRIISMIDPAKMLVLEDGDSALDKLYHLREMRIQA